VTPAQSLETDVAKIADLESIISELKLKLGEAEEKIKKLEEAPNSAPPPPGGDFGGAPPPPPPPGAPPPPPVFKPLNLKIVKQKPVQATVQTVEVTIAKPQTAIIEEIKSGVKLKKTEGPMMRRSTMTAVPNFGSLAAQMAKERQTRVATGNLRSGPVRSKKLDNILEKF